MLKLILLTVSCFKSHGFIRNLSFCELSTWWYLQNINKMDTLSSTPEQFKTMISTTSTQCGVLFLLSIALCNAYCCLLICPFITILQYHCKSFKLNDLKVGFHSENDMWQCTWMTERARWDWYSSMCRVWAHRLSSSSRTWISSVVTFSWKSQHIIKKCQPSRYFKKQSCNSNDFLPWRYWCSLAPVCPQCLEAEWVPVNYSWLVWWCQWFQGHPW